MSGATSKGVKEMIALALETSSLRDATILNK
jgi:hypothetical protein